MSVEPDEFSMCSALPRGEYSFVFEFSSRPVRLLELLVVVSIGTGANRRVVEPFGAELWGLVSDDITMPASRILESPGSERLKGGVDRLTQPPIQFLSCVINH